MTAMNVYCAQCFFSSLLLIRSMKFSAQGCIFIYIVSSVFVAMCDTGEYEEDTFLGDHKRKCDFKKQGANDNLN